MGVPSSKFLLSFFLSFFPFFGFMGSYLDVRISALVWWRRAGEMGAEFERRKNVGFRHRMVLLACRLRSIFVTITLHHNALAPQ
jgi:hypothetical protein